MGVVLKYNDNSNVNTVPSFIQVDAARTTLDYGPWCAVVPLYGFSFEPDKWAALAKYI